MANLLQTYLNEIKSQKDTYLLPENLKKDVSLLGVTGTLDGIDTTTETPITAEYVYTGLEGYANGEKVTGAMTAFNAGYFSNDNAKLFSNDEENNQLNVYVPNTNAISKPYALIPATSGRTLITHVGYDLITDAAGITADKIVEGNTILGIEGTAGGSTINNQDTEITENGTYVADEGYTGLGTVIVNVPTEINNQDIEITENGTYIAEEGYSGLGTVIVNVHNYIDASEFDGGCKMAAMYYSYGDGDSTSTYGPLYYVVSHINDWIDPTSYTNLESAFEENTYQIAVDFSNWDTRNVTTMASCFSASYFTDVNISNWVLAPDCSTMFYAMYRITGNITMENVDFRKVTDMRSMFYASYMTSLDFTNADFSNVTTMYGAFGSSHLTSITFTGATVSSALTNVQQMFYGASGLTELDLSSLEITGTTNFSQMFYNCSGLVTLDISGIDFTNATTYSNMFYKCTALTTVYVKDETAKTFVDTALAAAGLSITSTIKE